MHEFPKYVHINDTDLYGAIAQGLHPMQRLFDPKHDRLPFFGNLMAGGDFFGNRLHPAYSISHVPGRWLNALLNAQDAAGLPVDEEAIDTLRRWAYESVETNGLGLPCCIDLESRGGMPAKTKECDLHNLREAMHACYALAAYRRDERALDIAQTIIASVNRYYDFENARFCREDLLRERGGTLKGFGGPDYPFPMAMGRYIGPLVKLYKACGVPEALEQALRLKEVCFRDVLNEQGGYDAKAFGYHTHSTTSMLSSLARLGQTTGDMGILKRVHAFMENGLKQIATDFGWCLENYDRDDMGGECNNTADLIETWLILGQAGFPGAYEKAEWMLRAHLLPAQLLDTGFIPDCQDPEDERTYRIRQDSVGAFGFPSPWGHEDSPGSPISFNWDIVGGSVGGLCEAWRGLMTEEEGMLSVNLLFSREDERAAFLDPYTHGNTMTLTPKKPYRVLRIRMPEALAAEGLAAEERPLYTLLDGWLYLWRPQPGVPIRIETAMKQRETAYRFRNHRFRVRTRGQRVTGMSSKGKRLCFFPDLDA